MYQRIHHNRHFHYRSCTPIAHSDRLRPVSYKHDYYCFSWFRISLVLLPLLMSAFVVFVIIFTSLLINREDEICEVDPGPAPGSNFYQLYYYAARWLPATFGGLLCYSVFFRCSGGLQRNTGNLLAIRPADTSEVPTSGGRVAPYCPGSSGYGSPIVRLYQPFGIPYEPLLMIAFMEIQEVYLEL